MVAVVGVVIAAVVGVVVEVEGGVGEIIILVVVVVAVVGVLVGFQWFAAGVPGSSWAGPLRRLGIAGFQVQRASRIARGLHARCLATSSIPAHHLWHLYCHFRASCLGALAAPALSPAGWPPPVGGQGSGAAVARPTPDLGWQIKFFCFIRFPIDAPHSPPASTASESHAPSCAQGMPTKTTMHTATVVAAGVCRMTSVGGTFWSLPGEQCHYFGQILASFGNSGPPNKRKYGRRAATSTQACAWTHAGRPAL